MVKPISGPDDAPANPKVETESQSLPGDPGAAPKRGLAFTASGPGAADLSRGDIIAVSVSTFERMAAEERQSLSGRYYSIGLDQDFNKLDMDLLQFLAGAHLLTAPKREPGPHIGVALLYDLFKRKYLPIFRALGLLHLDGSFAGGPAKAKEWFELGVKEGSRECLCDL